MQLRGKIKRPNQSRFSNSAQGPQIVPKVLKQLQPHPVAHSMLEHVVLADHVEHGEVGHLTEAGPEGLVADVADAAEVAGVSHTIHAPSSSTRSKVLV